MKKLFLLLILFLPICCFAAEEPTTEKTLNVDSIMGDFVQKISFDPPCQITQNKLSGNGIMYKIYMPKANTSICAWQLGLNRFYAELEMLDGQPNYAFKKVAAYELWKKADASYKKQPAK